MVCTDPVTMTIGRGTGAPYLATSTVESRSDLNSSVVSDAMINLETDPLTQTACQSTASNLDVIDHIKETHYSSQPTILPGPTLPSVR